MNNRNRHRHNGMIQLQKDQADNLDFPLQCPVYVCHKRDQTPKNSNKEPTSSTIDTHTVTTTISYAGTVKGVFITTSPKTTLVYQIQTCIEGNEMMYYVPKERIRFQNGCTVFVKYNYCHNDYHQEDEDDARDVRNDKNDDDNCRRENMISNCNFDRRRKNPTPKEEVLFQGIIVGFCDIPPRAEQGKRQLGTTTEESAGRDENENEEKGGSFWYSVLLIHEKDVARVGGISILHQVSHQNVSFRRYPDDRTKKEEYLELEEDEEEKSTLEDSCTIPKEISIEGRRQDKNFSSTCVLDLCSLDSDDDKEEEEEEGNDNDNKDDNDNRDCIKQEENRPNNVQELDHLSQKEQLISHTKEEEQLTNDLDDDKDNTATKEYDVTQQQSIHQVAQSTTRKRLKNDVSDDKDKTRSQELDVTEQHTIYKVTESIPRNDDTHMELESTVVNESENRMETSNSKKRTYEETLENDGLSETEPCWWQDSDSSSSSSIVQIKDMVPQKSGWQVAEQEETSNDRDDDAMSDGNNQYVKEVEQDDYMYSLNRPGKKQKLDRKNNDKDVDDDVMNDGNNQYEKETEHDVNQNENYDDSMSEERNQYEKETVLDDYMHSLNHPIENPTDKQTIVDVEQEQEILKSDKCDQSDTALACKDESIMAPELVIIDDSDSESDTVEVPNDPEIDPIVNDSLFEDDNFEDDDGNDSDSHDSNNKSSTLDLNSFMIGRKSKSFEDNTSLISQLSSWRNVSPGPSDELIKEFNGRTYYWCQKCRDEKGMWALHHKDNHIVDNGDCCIPHWTELPPSDNEPHSIKVKGMWYSWCEKCRGGKGQWSVHAIGNHWRCEAPKPNEPLCKMKGDLEFYWCNMCRSGRGMWARHQSSDHSFDYDQKPSAASVNDNVQNPDYQGAIFSKFLDCERDLFQLARKNAKSVPNSSQDPSIKICITYHVRGRCKMTCKRALDHTRLTSAKAQELYQWCKKVTSPPPAKPCSESVVLPVSFEYIQKHLIGKNGRIHSMLLKKTNSSKIQYRKQKKRVKMIVEHKDKASVEKAMLEVQKFLAKSVKREKKKK